MDIHAVEQEIEAFEPREFTGGVDARDIDAAAEAVGLPFPPEYRQFLGRFGSGFVSFQEFIGLGGPGNRDVVETTQHLREHSKISRFPQTFIPLLTDGGGNFECIDTSSPTRGGEFAIVHWLHDGGDQQDCERLAETYWEWFESVLEMIKSIDSEDVEA